MNRLGYQVIEETKSIACVSLETEGQLLPLYTPSFPDPGAFQTGPITPRAAFIHSNAVFTPYLPVFEAIDCSSKNFPIVVKLASVVQLEPH